MSNIYNFVGIVSKLRDAVISFTPKSRPSIIGRNDLFYRYGKSEQEALACFEFLEDELKNCCDEFGGVCSTIDLVDFELLNDSCCDQCIPDWRKLVIEQEEGNFETNVPEKSQVLMSEVEIVEKTNNHQSATMGAQINNFPSNRSNVSSKQKKKYKQKSKNNKHRK